MKNFGWFLTDRHTFEKRDMQMPQLKADEVLIHPEYVGICGSDLHWYDDPITPPVPGYKVPLPLMLGHEVGGVVAAVGESVTTLKVGDRVAVEPGVPCGICPQCKAGRYNLCEKMLFMAAPPFKTGALCNYFAHPAHMTFKLPDNVSTKEGALLEPLAVGMHGTNLAGIGLGDTAVILGCGCIGLTVLQSCLAKGASKVIVVDIFDKRLEKATQLGATAVINSMKEDLVSRVKEILGGKLPSYVFETAGNRITTGQTAGLVARGGTIVIVGTPQGDVPFNFSLASTREARIMTVFRYRNIYPVALEAVSTGKICVSDIASHEFAFKDVPEAFQQSLTQKQEIVKAVIHFEEE